MRWAETRWGGPATALAAILAGAAALRTVGIQYGLPYDNLLNPDEHNIVVRAWRMVHGGGADPHFFDYPTLLMYLDAPFQAWQGSPSLLTARIVGIVLGLASIAATWWLAQRAYGNATAGAVAAAIVAVCTVHVAYSREAVTDVPLTLGIAASLALMVTGRIELAGIAAGIATGFKYPGVFLVVPLVVAAWGQWRRLAVGLVAMVAAFAASSPFVLVYFLDLLTIRAHFDRYTLPLIPPLAALASRFRPLAPVTLLLLVVPLTWSIRDTKELTRTDTRVVAARWVEAHVPAGSEVAVDPSVPMFPRLRLLPLQLPGPGRDFDPNRDLAKLRRERVRWVVVTGAVADRVFAARGRYPRDAAFYDDLRRHAERRYFVDPGDGRAGPWVAVYRL